MTHPSAAAPVKVFCFFARRPDLTEQQFHDHWRHPHGTMAKRITSVRRYVQAHAVGDQPTSSSGHDGVAELWFDDIQTANTLNEDADYADYCGKDEWNFMDLGPRAFRVLTRCEPLFGTPTFDGESVKIMLLIRLADRATGDDVITELASDAHIDSAKASGATAGVLNPALPESYVDALPPEGTLHHWLSLEPFDLVYELWWPDRAAADRALDGSTVSDLMTAPGIDTENSRVLLTHDEVVIP